MRDYLAEQLPRQSGSLAATPFANPPMALQSVYQGSCPTPQSSVNGAMPATLVFGEMGRGGSSRMGSGAVGGVAEPVAAQGVHTQAQAVATALASSLEELPLTRLLKVRKGAGT